ncbi:hypothetical protein GGI13_003841 [Coemansia sp. RSA 455]|nr:hypothetical protein GGI13_003841 [Coemansia sp. RSA 455]
MARRLPAAAATPGKRGPGRPRKNTVVPKAEETPAKRGPGRPRRNTVSPAPVEVTTPEESAEEASPAPVESPTPAVVEATTPAKRGRGRPKKFSVVVDTPAAKPVEPAAKSVEPVARQPSPDPVEEQLEETVSPGKRRRGRPPKTPKTVDIDVEVIPTEKAAPPVTRARQARTLPWVRSKRLATSEAQAPPLPTEEAAATTPEKLPEEPVRVESSEEEPAPQTPVADTPTSQGRRHATDNTPPINITQAEGDLDSAATPSRPVRRGRPPGSTKAAKEAALAAARAAAVAAGLDPSTVTLTPKKSGSGRGRGRGILRSPLVRGQILQPVMFSLPTPPPPKPRAVVSDEESDEYVAGSAGDDEDDDVEVTNDSYDDSDSDTSKRTPKKKLRVNTLLNTTKKQGTGGYTPVDFSAKRTVRLDRRWGGPQLSNRLGNPYRIDLGLDQETWSVLRSMRVNRDCFEIETDKDMLASAIPTSGKVHVAMLSGSGEPLRSDKAPIKLGPHDVHELIDETTGWVANTGLSACSVDWAPVGSDLGQSGSASCVDFVAVGGINLPAGSSCSPATCAVEQCATERVKGAKPGSIQIWRADTASKTAGSCRLSMILTHTFGRCIKLKWCPVSLAPNAKTDAAMPIIGYLAVVFGDGYLRVCAVPHPDGFDSGTEGPVCVRWPKFSLVEISAPHGIFTSLAWASSDLLVAGTSLGSVTAWLLGSSIRAQHANWMASKRGDRGPWPYSIPAEFFENDDCQLAPIVNFPVHTCMVSAIDTFCGGQINSSEGSLFTKISVSNIQIISASDLGRIQQTLVAFPARHHHTIAIMASKPRALAIFWPTANFLYGDADNCVRLTVGGALINPGDPWVYAGFDGKQVGRELANTWNSPTDLSAIYALNLSGAVLDIAVSEFHSYIVASSSDGSVLIQNILGFDNSSRRAPMFRKIYSLLWYPHLKQNALLEDNNEANASADVEADEERLVCLGRTPIQARPVIPRGGTGKGNKAKRDDDDDVDDGSKRAKGARASSAPKTTSRFYVYPAQTAVQACAWSRNSYSAHWVASVCAVGLLRIEDVSL